MFGYVHDDIWSAKPARSSRANPCTFDSPSRSPASYVASQTGAKSQVGSAAELNAIPISVGKLPHGYLPLKVLPLLLLWPQLVVVTFSVPRRRWVH